MSEWRSESGHDQNGRSKISSSKASLSYSSQLVRDTEEEVAVAKAARMVERVGASLSKTEDIQEDGPTCRR